MDSKIETLINTPMTFDDVKSLMFKAVKDRVRVIEVDKMCNSKHTINEIMDTTKSRGVILYIPIQATTGHFVSLYESDDDKIVFFTDSYGFTPRAILDIIEQTGIKITKLCLFKQLRDEYPTGFYNSFKYQGDNTSCCGRYSCANLIFKIYHDEKNMKYDINVFKNCMDELCRKYQCGYDEAVTRFTHQFE